MHIPITPQKANIRHCEERVKTSDEAIQNAPRNDNSALGILRCNGYNIKKTLGFTLIELLLVLIITAVIVAGSSTLLVQGFRSYSVSKNFMETNWQNMIAIESMLRDLRTIRSPNDINNATITNTSFTYTAVSGNTITFNINNSILSRTEQGNSQNVANNLTNLTFNYYDANGAAINTTNASQISLIRYIIMDFGSGNPKTAIYPWNLK